MQKMPGRMDKPDMLRYVSVGTEFIVTFGVPLCIGLLLDRRYGTIRYTLIGAAVGFAAAMYRMIRLGRSIRGKDGRGEVGQPRGEERDDQDKPGQQEE